MGTRPTGTVTFLFTDIEGSTKLAREHLDAWETARARHDDILRGAIESNHGFVFQIVGDAFCAAFHKAGDSLKAGITAQRILQKENGKEFPIRVRMGIHTGEAEAQDNDYRGYLSLSLVQRVMAAGHGGQLLVSGATENLLRDHLSQEIRLMNLGRHNFKDVPQAVRVFQVIAPGLQIDFPPLRTSNILPNNLRTQLTSFIGREKELGDVKKLLQNTHLLSLIGPGGTGKTRLAIEAAGQMLDQYPDGVWLVELATILDPALVPRSTAIAIGLRDEPQRPVIAMLCDYLQKKKMLILLDNCEHLVEACAQMADRILHVAADVRILASSREALGVSGEVTYRVPSLRLPEIEHLPSLESLSQYEAVKLFIDRATAAVPSFNVSNSNALALAEICHRLDGIPLAIELAASKVRVLSMEELAKRLDDRFRLLTGGSRTALERHQTLRATVDWSYNLLPPAEQALFRRLSVFIGGWTLEAAEAVCSGGSVASNIQGEDVLNLMEQLINKSLVGVEEEHSSSRYRMLETIRQYANEKLLESDEGIMMRDRHLEYFINLAETAAPHLIRPEQLEWFSRLDADYENLRMALQWALGKEATEPSLNFCTALGWFWEIRCYWLEGLNWLKKSLEKSSYHASDIEKIARARAFYTRAELEWQVGNFEKLLSAAQNSLALASEVSDRKDIAIARFYLGVAMLTHEGDNEKAGSLFEQSVAEFQALDEAFWQAYAFPYLGYLRARQAKLKFHDVADRYLELARKAGERWILAGALSNYAFVLAGSNQVDEARESAEESDKLFRQIGSEKTSHRLELFAELAWVSGDYQRARSLFMQMEELYRVLGAKMERALCIKGLGLLAMEENDLARSEAYLEEALVLMQEAGHKFFISICLVEISNLYYLRGNIEGYQRNFRESIFSRDSLDEYHRTIILMTILGTLYVQQPEISAGLIGVIDKQERENHFLFTPIVKRYCARADAHARKVLGDARFKTAFAEGQKISLDDALDMVIKVVEETKNV